MPNHPYLGYQLNDIFFYRPYPYGSKGAVSTNSPYAAQAGLEILRQGATYLMRPAPFPWCWAW